MTTALALALFAVVVGGIATVAGRRRPSTPRWTRALAALAVVGGLVSLGMTATQAVAIEPSTPSAVGRNSVRADTPADAGPAAITGTATLTLGPAARSGTLTVSLYASPRAGAPGRIQGSRRVRVANGSRSVGVTSFCRPGRDYATWYVVADAAVTLRSGRTIPLHDVSNVGQLSRCRPLA